MLCPVDRYMVNGSRGLEMVKILEDESWTAEPTLRPEDELVLRRLRDLLQATADDLKVLSTELAAPRLSSSRLDAQFTPLDEEFNQKVHIEQMVNAKFHGQKVKNVNQGFNVKRAPQKLVIEKKRSVNTGVQVDLPNEAEAVLPQTGRNKKPTHSNNTLERESDTLNVKEVVLNQSEDSFFIKGKVDNLKKLKASKSVVYNEISHVEQEIKSTTPRKILKIQDMPSINIRSELRQQQVLQLDIFPDIKDTQKQLTNRTNSAVIEVQHKSESSILTDKKDKTTQSKIRTEKLQGAITIPQTSRKVLKMSTCESSDYNSSDAPNNVPKVKKGIKSPHMYPKSILSKPRKVNDHKAKSDNTRFGVDDWKKKLNIIYGQASTSRQDLKSVKNKKKTNNKNISSKESNVVSTNTHNKVTKLNNAQYVPYSQLTLGGVRLSDIEREVPDINKKADEPLSPILDKILSERKESDEKEKASPKVLNTSDENLLREVVEIEKNVNRVINSNFVKIPKNILKSCTAKSGDHNNENPNENSSYDDDFEEDRQSSDPSWTSSKKENTSKQNSDELKTSNKTVSNNDYVEEKNYETDNGENSDVDNSFDHSKNKTYIKSSNLSFKDSVDVFEFVHAVDTQDTATQSNRLLLKETQTSPRQEIAPVTNVNPIHNDLWQSSIDPKGEIEKMFKLEKDFIRKLILDEYGDILEKDITKPSTSKDKEKGQSKNVVIVQKNTQTSPAHVKSIMTSPKKTKTRTTSPVFSNSLVHRHTSPLVNDTVATKSSGESQCDIEDLGISVNLSSPRFTLKLPQTSREVLSNLEPSERYQKEKNKKDKATSVNKTITSSSSIDTDRSDSEFGSLGEVDIRLRRKQLRDQLRIISDSSSTSTVSKSSTEVQSAKGRLKSEGEISSGQLF